MFPKNFLWGAATSSHQVEGNNNNNDWWLWEKQARCIQVSGDAAKHYQLYREDFDLAKSFFHNCHRFSIEWSRVQPQEDRFDFKQIRHYKDVITALHSRGIQPVVTLHHFTNPVWFAKRYGWLSIDSPKYFARYVEFVVKSLGREVKYWITINEPMVLIFHSLLQGNWPPGEQSFSKALIAVFNLIRAHIRAYKLIHRIYKENNWLKPKVSIAKNITIFRPCQIKNNILNKIACKVRDKLANTLFLDRIKKYIDFIGLNYYSLNYIEFGKLGPLGLMGFMCGHNDMCNPLKRNTLDWLIYPEGILEAINKLQKYNLDILITENGVTIEDDSQRWEFIKQHLMFVQKAIASGIKVIGYIYWSLIDNFEWDKGFGPRFGLVEIDYRTFKRNIRESALKFARICRDNSI